MLPINRLPIKTRSGDVFPHVRSRWVRAGGTSWAHQAPSITLWQESLEHGGASVEPQVKMYGVGCVSNAQQGYVWMSHLYAGSISFIHKLACRHALHMYMLYVCTDLTSPTCPSSLMRSGLAEPTTCTTPEPSVRENFQPSDTFHPRTRFMLVHLPYKCEQKTGGEEKNDACEFDNR